MSALIRAHENSHFLYDNSIHTVNTQNSKIANFKCTYYYVIEIKLN